MGLESPNRRPVNRVFQSYALFPHMAITQNIGFGLKMQDVPDDEGRRRVADVIELVQLEGREHRKPRQLSGGQQQRVALARALVNRPKVLLLDEPLGALDLKLRQAMQFELKQMQERVGITFIYVTHDQEQALTMSDLIGIEHGGLQQVAVRPEKLGLRRIDADRDPALDAVHGRVERATFLGDAIAYGVRVGTGDGAHLVEVRQGNAPGIEHFAVGDDVRVRWSPSSATVLED